MITPTMNFMRGGSRYYNSYKLWPEGRKNEQEVKLMALKFVKFEIISSSLTVFLNN